MKKVLQLAVVCFLAVFMSCSEEETLVTDVDVAAQELATDLSEYEGTSLGLFKGVFTTDDSAERGVVAIEVISEILAKAEITLVSGEVIDYTGIPSRTGSGELIVELAAYNSSFEFVVAEDGSNPSINRAVLNDVPSSISMVKQNTRGVAPTTMTGTYDGDFSGTFNFIFDFGGTTGSTMDITTQVVVGGGTIETIMGNSQAACVANGTNTAADTCGIDGSLSGPGGSAITWTGARGFLNTGGPCDALAGTWTGTSGAGSAISGTFISDDACDFGCLSPLSSGSSAPSAAISNTLPAVMDAISVADSGIIGVNAILDNVSLNITHTWDGDVAITLTSPAGTTHDLSIGLGGSADNYTGTVFTDGAPSIATGAAPFTGMFEAQGGPFATAFAGESITGDWTLNVLDNVGGDDGTLDDWSISFCSTVVRAPSVVSKDDDVINSRVVEEVQLTKEEYKRLHGIE